MVMNGMEIMGTIKNITPTTTDIWDFRRDIHWKIWIFTPSDANVPNKQPTLDSEKNFMGGPPAFNDDARDIDEDLTPDSSNEIFVWDYPGIKLNSSSLIDAPSGTVVTYRFHAREWVELNGNRVSGVIEWFSFITIRKEPNNKWKRVGWNEIRKLAPAESFPSDVFTRDEALAAMSE
jgi:hypothetical protein